MKLWAGIFFVLIFNFSVKAQPGHSSSSTFNAGSVSASKDRNVPKDLFVQTFYYTISYKGPLPQDTILKNELLETVRKELNSLGIKLDNGSGNNNPTKSIVFFYEVHKSNPLKRKYSIEIRSYIGIPGPSDEYYKISGSELTEVLTELKERIASNPKSYYYSN